MGKNKKKKFVQVDMSKFEIQNTQHVNLSNTKLDNQESSSYKNHKTELDKGRTEKNVEFPVNSNNSHDFDDANNSTTINKEQRSNFQRNRAQGEEYYVTDKHQRQKSPEDGNFRYQKNSAQSDRNHPQSSDKGGKYSNSRYFSSNNSSIKNNEKEFTETPRRSQDNRSDGRNRNFNNWSYKGMGRGQYVERKYGENRDSNRSYNYNQNNEDRTRSGGNVNWRKNDSQNCVNSSEEYWGDDQNVSQNAKNIATPLPNAHNASDGQTGSILSPESSNLNPEANSFHILPENDSQSFNESPEKVEDTSPKEENWDNEIQENSICDAKKAGSAQRKSDKDNTSSSAWGNNSVISVGDEVADSLDKSRYSDWNNSKPKQKNRKSNSSVDLDSSYDVRNSTPRSKDISLIPKYVDLNDEEKKEFIEWKSNSVKGKVIEEEKDLFSVGKEYSLAHCVAADMSMGSGIAVEFKRRFKKVEELYDQKQRQGGLAHLKFDDRFIYYLVTKKYSTGKPTYNTLWNSLTKLRDHMKENAVEKLAIPRIGCGLDRLEWSIVKMMLEFLFSKSEVEVLVCNFQQDEGTPSPGRSHTKCKIVHPNYSITEIEHGTIIIYFASRDGKETKIMKELDQKFKYLPAFKNERKNLGEVIRFEDKRGFILYGCIVKEKIDDFFSFVNYKKCLNIIQKNNKKDNYYFVGFQKVYDVKDDIMNDKILYFTRDSLKDIDIYCCDYIQETA